MKHYIIHLDKLLDLLFMVVAILFFAILLAIMGIFSYDEYVALHFLSSLYSFIEAIFLGIVLGIGAMFIVGILEFILYQEFKFLGKLFKRKS